MNLVVEKSEDGKKEAFVFVGSDGLFAQLEEVVAGERYTHSFPVKSKFTKRQEVEESVECKSAKIRFARELEDRKRR